MQLRVQVVLQRLYELWEQGQAQVSLQSLHDYCQGSATLDYVLEELEFEGLIEIRRHEETVQITQRGINRVLGWIMLEKTRTPMFSLKSD